MTLYRRIDRLMHQIAAAMALAGGAVLVALVVMTTASVTGRALIVAGLGPVPGDFELVEMGTAFAVFAFLPWCQITGGHARVEVFTARLPRRARAVLDAAADLAFMAVAVLITWRLWLGLADKRAFGETTFILQWPLWWAYAAAFFASVVFVAVSMWCVVRSFSTLAGRQAARPAP
ncbi:MULTISPECIES: TRAP transporter small permease subunit [unclassified Roseitalea]|uniref:TRAP transporter small permease n=1 Tax=unclassified Roseitalea TaxID=2639107 RepID=UPI00273D5B36|nr:MULTISPECIES: TRAP transporter small permease subunit [unclassified Roseitalea]